MLDNFKKLVRARKNMKIRKKRQKDLKMSTPQYISIFIVFAIKKKDLEDCSFYLFICLREKW